MIMNKKGLSDVVTTVLIILLAIAAIVIVWNFVSPTLENAGEQIESQTACLDARVSVVSCEVGVATGTNVVIRNDGGQTINYKVIVNHVATGTEGTTSVDATESADLQAYGTVTVGRLILADESVRVAVTNIGGTAVSCDPTPAEACT